MLPLSGCFHYQGGDCYVDPWTAYCKVALKPGETVVPGQGYASALIGQNSAIGSALIGARLVK